MHKNMQKLYENMGNYFAFDPHVVSTEDFFGELSNFRFLFMVSASPSTPTHARMHTRPRAYTHLHFLGTVLTCIMCNFTTSEPSQTYFPIKTWQRVISKENHFLQTSPSAVSEEGADVFNTNILPKRKILFLFAIQPGDVF